MMASPIWSPIVITGLSELIGSWKIMAMSRPRISGMAESGCSSRLTPLSSIRPCAIRPGGSGISRRMASEVTDLPEPDSPTMPSRSPGAMSKLLSSTAATGPSSVW